MMLWEAVHTQWRGAGFGVIGLDYDEVRSWAREMLIGLTPRIWNGIRTLERFELQRQSSGRTDA